MPPRELPWTSEILLPGDAPARVMLLAGFGSGPETLRELGEEIHACTGSDVLLAGLSRHGGDTREFLRSRSWHFLRAAEERFLQYWATRATPVLLGGYSTGALLALILAARHPEKVTGLVLVSPALRLSQTEKQLIGYTVGSVYYVLLPAGLLGTLAAFAWHGRRRGWTHGRRWLAAMGTLGAFATATLGLRAVTVPLAQGGPVTRQGEEVLPPHFKHASLLTGSTLVPLQLAARWRLRRLTLPVCFVFGQDDAVVDVRFGTLCAAAQRGAELHVVPDAPHRVVTYERCQAAVCDFVTRTWRQRGG